MNSESRTMTTYRRTDGEETWVLESSEVTTFAPVCSQCDEQATHWGLCEPHAREDDPEFFAVPVPK